MKRLFLAIPLPEATQKDLVDFLEPYKTHPSLRSAKWVAPENLHVTALFLGEVPDGVLPELLQLASAVCARMQPFELIPNGVACFPLKTHSKMIWYRYQNSLAFEEFVSELKKFLEPTLGPLEEGKESLPHATLARLKEGIDPKVISFQGRPWPTLSIHSATLYEANIQPEGPHYKIIQTFPFEF